MERRLGAGEGELGVKGREPGVGSSRRGPGEGQSGVRGGEPGVGKGRRGSVEGESGERERNSGGCGWKEPGSLGPGEASLGAWGVRVGEREPGIMGGGASGRGRG